MHAPSASHNCSVVARNFSWASAARAAGSVSPPATTFRIRRALAPSRSKTKLDNLMWAFQQSLQLVLQVHPIACQLVVAARHRPPQTLLRIGHNLNVCTTNAGVVASRHIRGRYFVISIFWYVNDTDSIGLLPPLALLTELIITSDIL